jgi:CheY-like chemotaxis protein
LVVDDDPDIRDALCELLEDEGYRAVSAANGQEALTYLKSSDLPCVILLDLMMPVMDGWAFRAEQRRSGNTVPIVLLSAAGELGRHQELLGAAAIIPKPFDIDHVISAIEGVC